jgi:hypothetical protein
MPKVSKKTTQKKLMEELFTAQCLGFIEKIEIELDKFPQSSWITYDPDAMLYKTDWAFIQSIRNDDLVFYKKDVVKAWHYLDNLPYCKTICLKFRENVLQDTIDKICLYITDKYNYKCSLQPSNVLDISAS